MLAYCVKRLLTMLLVILGVTFLTFSLMNLAPGDAAEMIAQGRYGSDLSREQVEAVRKAEDLGAPMPVRYLRCLKSYCRGDLGHSQINGRSVWEEIRRNLGPTLRLALASMAISLVIAITVGVLSAARKNSIVDYAGVTFALLGVSIPNFWLALLLMLVFALHLGWFPVFGIGGIRHLVLPAVTLGTSLAAISTRMIRAGMLDVLAANYIRTARGRGLGEPRVIGKHALRAAMIPVVTVVGLQFVHLLEGAVIVEVIFARPGMGKLLVDSILARDFTMVQGCTLVIGILVCLLNLAVDLSYALLDPRIRYAKKGARH